MNIQEFSNTFDTLLNSYNTQALFGETSSKREITLDEYEKSVLLTQAQDIIVKSYFDSISNPLGQGFDDSIRRQLDFSALISTARIPIVYPRTKVEVTFPNNIKLLFENISSKTVTIIFKDNCVQDRSSRHQGLVDIGSAGDNTSVQYDLTIYSENIDDEQLDFEDLINEIQSNTRELNITLVEGNIYDMVSSGQITPGNIIIDPCIKNSYDDRGVLVSLNKDILLILNEKVIDSNNNSLVVVPINYKEYDRQLSRAYTQPLKKQVWRLFENDSNLKLKSELIPASGTTMKEYRIRYLRRPRPIILVDFSADGLDIDGLSTPNADGTACELHPIIHMDILNKAVELAISTRGGHGVPSGPASQASTNRNQ